MPYTQSEVQPVFFSRRTDPPCTSTVEDAFCSRRAIYRSMTAPKDTKRGYGLWRGEVIHPADPRMDDILASGDPITDTKGLGLRYVPVRGARVVSHFRVHDPEKFSAALDRMYPAIHDAVVRVVAEDMRVGGFDALARWCAGGVLPEPFVAAGVEVEGRCEAGGVVYRPDVTVRHPEGGRIELEVVNTHAPETGRLDAAWGAGHIVLSLRIRELVEAIVFSEGRGAVPEDAALLEMLRGRQFRLCGRDRLPAAVQAVWRDLNLSAYAMELREVLRAAFQEDAQEVVAPVCEVLNGISGSDLDPRVRKPGVLRDLHNLFDRGMNGLDARGPWLRAFRESVTRASRPTPSLLEASETAETFLDGFTHASHEPAGVRRLRYAVAAVWFLRKHRLASGANSGSVLLNMRAPKFSESSSRPLVATEQGIL